MTIQLRLRYLVKRNIRVLSDIDLVDNFGLSRECIQKAHKIYLVDDDDRIIKVFKDITLTLESTYPEQVVVKKDIMRWHSTGIEIIRKGEVLSLTIDGYSNSINDSFPKTVRMEYVVDNLGDLFSIYEPVVPICSTYYSKPMLLENAKEFCDEKDSKLNSVIETILTNFINQLKD